MPVRVSAVRRVERRLQLGPREAEVEQLHAVRRQEHVRRLEIAMDDAARVQRRERGQHAEADRHRLARRSAARAAAARPATSPSSSSMAMNSSPRVLADLVDLADVRMIDAGRGAGLAPEALARGLVVGQRRHRLQRDRALAAARRAPRRRRPSRLRRACGRWRSGRCGPGGGFRAWRLLSRASCRPVLWVEVEELRRSATRKACAASLAGSCPPACRQPQESADHTQIVSLNSARLRPDHRRGGYSPRSASIGSIDVDRSAGT